MWVVLAGVIAVTAVYCWDRFPLEMVSAGVLCALLLFFLAFPLPDDHAPFGAREILAGFANPALVTIMALLVVGQGMFHTGAMEGPAQRLSLLSERRPRAVLTLVFATVFVVSAFMNNTPLVVMFIPIMAALAGRRGQAPSKIMMHLSFVCILAGMTTLIGSSTNLLVADALMQQTGDRLGFFDPTIPGLAIAIPGLIYIALFLGRFLPDRPFLDDLADSSGRQFIAQIVVGPDHPLVGRRPTAGMFPDLPDMTVRLIQRGEHALLPPFDEDAIRPGDIVIVAATRQKLRELLTTRAEFLQGFLQAEEAAHLEEREGGALGLIEAVVAPGSRIIGRTIEQSGFRNNTGCIVLGVQRRSRMIRSRMSEIRLDAGDVLLLVGMEEDFRNLRTQRDVLPLEWSADDVPDVRRSGLARGIFAGAIALAATGVTPILHAAVLGAFLMVATRCLNPRQAVRAFDLRIFLLIGAAFALGSAMQATGAADVLAAAVVEVFAPFGPAALVSALFLLVALLTNILSNSATAILFAPIAIAVSERIDVDPSVLVLTIIFAANCSFATPIAYQTNLLVMGPGRYRFGDFVRAGAPLVILLWAVYSVFAPWYFGF